VPTTVGTEPTQRQRLRGMIKTCACSKYW
jgi:hypothetical protein